MSTNTKPVSPYIGRFAPSPTGELHFGSLIAAVGSYVDARAHNGKWLLRFEDVDTTRCRREYRDAMLKTLARFSLHHDGESIVQTERLSDYADALIELSELTYLCVCSRKMWQKDAKIGEIGKIYPRTCYYQPPKRVKDAVTRLALPDGQMCFVDRLRGEICYNLQCDIGDPILRRQNGDFAYALAVCVDDAQQGITHIVRGADLLATTPIQRVIQAHLGYATPSYLHLPLALDENGRKLSKQNHAQPINAQADDTTVSDLLVDVLEFLDAFFTTSPPRQLRQSLPCDVLEWAVAHWRM